MKNGFLSKVFMWLFIGLLTTFACGYYICSSSALLSAFVNDGIYLICIIAQIILCIVLSARLEKMKLTTAKILFILYAILTGVTFAGIFAVFELGSVIFVFLATAIVFGIFAFIGHVTKFDLSSFGTYALMALIAVIILEIINMFLLNSTVSFLVIIISVLVFVVFTAYDMQRLRIFESIGVDEESKEKYAILGAFELYLDFINLFIELLKLFGKSRD